MASEYVCTVKIDLSQFETNVLKRKLTEDEAKIVIGDITAHINSDIKEYINDNTNAPKLIKIWQAIDMVIKRPMTKDEHKIILKEYYGSPELPSSVIIKKSIDIASKWIN